MNKIIIIILLAVVMAGGGFYFFVVRQPTISSIAPDSETTKNPTNILQLIAEGKNQKCIFDYTSPEGTSKDEIYVNTSGQVRRDSQVQVKETLILSTHTIITKQDQYLWVDNGEVADHFLIDERYWQNADVLIESWQKDGWSCASWTLDPSKFVPPKNITFNEVNLRTK